MSIDKEPMRTLQLLGVFVLARSEDIAERAKRGEFDAAEADARLAELGTMQNAVVRLAGGLTTEARRQARRSLAELGAPL